MSKSRKTVSVASLLKWANTQLFRTDDGATKAFKIGICGFIEHTLHETGNYSGFGFLSTAHCDTGSYGFYTRYYYVSDKIRSEYRELTENP